MTATTTRHFDVRMGGKIHPVNPQYPKAWRGNLCLAFRVWTGRFDSVIRLRWEGRYLENDWQGIDTAKRIRIAPRWAKWFEFSSYYAGQHRNMYHLTIGRFGASWLPLTNGDCAWWR